MQLRLGESALTLAHSLESNSVPLPRRDADRSEITGRKGSIYYRAHSYHTKVPPEGIARLIEHYTDPGGVVLDPFCGSGMTGVAARMTGRLAVLSDLSPAACHIASGYAADSDPVAVRAAGDQMLAALAEVEAALYGTKCPSCDGPARIEYTVWSDVHRCPSCQRELLFWSEAVDQSTGAIAKQLDCACGLTWRKRDLTWLRSVPVLQSVSCRRCKGRHERVLDGPMDPHCTPFAREDVPFWYPTVPFASWREMWRGQHREQGIATSADFFTPRNLYALAAAWHWVNSDAPAEVRPALRFVFTASVNRASRRYQWNPKRPTNVLSSTMYIASLSYEFNVFSLLGRKLSAAVGLYRTTEQLPGGAVVHRSPAQRLSHVPDGSVDYVFTDPPFGSNIFYADSSFLWEAWLGESTNTEHEAVVHQSQRAEHGGKTLQDYEKLMLEAFGEVARVLRPNGWASVMFHNSNDEVWSSLEHAIEGSGFEVGAAVAFDKSQASFKGLKGQLAGEKVPNFDLVLHLWRPTERRTKRPVPEHDVRTLISSRLEAHVAVAPPSRRTTPYLHSLAMRVLLEENLPIDGFSYSAIESLCDQLFAWDSTTSNWTAKEGSRD